MLLDWQGHPIPRIHFQLLAQVGHPWMVMVMATRQVPHLTTVRHQCNDLRLKQMHLPHIQVSVVDLGLLFFFSFLGCWIRFVVWTLDLDAMPKGGRSGVLCVNGTRAPLLSHMTVNIPLYFHVLLERQAAIFIQFWSKMGRVCFSGSVYKFMKMVECSLWHVYVGRGDILCFHGVTTQKTRIRIVDIVLWGVFDARCDSG